MLMSFFVFATALFASIFYGDMTEEALRAKIDKMIIIGFDGQELNASSPFVQQLQTSAPGGVILFDREYRDRNVTKNIRSPQQLKALNTQLQRFSKTPLLIAVDQEGGKVMRLKPAYGFLPMPSAKAVGEKDDPAYAEAVYGAAARELSAEGINTDFAPVADLSVNPENYVIYGLERSYGKSPQKVAAYAGIFIDALRRNGVVPVLKHFPGHGSSLGDSHKGFVDVTQTWNAVELEPYKILIDEGRADMIMTTHVYNKRLDPDYPATLSKAVNTDLLRDKLGFKGVIVSDDLQMKAISEQYDLDKTVRLAVNAGVDMLLFGNQLDRVSLKAVEDAVYHQVQAGNIDPELIFAANRRIDALYAKYGIGAAKIIDRPIDFGPERIELTKAYIEAHYGKTVDDITIDPKIIVLHWTADMDLNSSFGLLKPERLPGARGDIASAGALNVSSHFLVDRDGTIYRLMPENKMARHVIGLNYSSIGIENVGGEGNEQEDLTPEQVEANIALVRYLKGKYPGIEYLMGHYEYRQMETTLLWLEKDEGYRTVKRDPGETFMAEVRQGVDDLELKTP